MRRASRRMSGPRELAFPPLPYIAVYQVKEHAVEIRASFMEPRTGPNVAQTEGLCTPLVFVDLFIAEGLSRI